MTNQTSTHDEAVAECWHQLESGRLARVIEIVNKRELPVKERHQRRVNAALQNPTMTLGTKIEALWECVDEIGEIAWPYVA